MKTSSTKCFSCSLCPYTTKKKYNLERHTVLVHKQNETNCAQNVADSQNVTKVSQNVSCAFKCLTCYKKFTTKGSLERHVPHCKHIADPLECDRCGLTLPNRTAKSRHMKTCTVSSLNPSHISNTTHHSITNSHNTTTNNIGTLIQNQNNVNLLVFPYNEEEFDFATGHIKDASMKEYITHKTPEVGFRRFMGKVLENPQNRIVSKSSVKDCYSKIHLGAGRWEWANDKKVMPVVAHHMTTAALQKMDDMKERKVLDTIRSKAKEFTKYIEEVNTNDECETYRDVLDDIKLLLVNMFNL